MNFSTLKKDKILLDELESLLKHLRTTNSINNKIEMIKSKPHLKSFLQLIHSPDSKFYITSSSIQKYEGIPNDNLKYDSITDLLKGLSCREITGKSAVREVYSYMKLYPEHEALIKDIIDKNLKARIGNDLINKSFENEIKKNSQSIQCSLGHSIENHMEYLQKSINKGEEWFISRKYDGIRTFLVYNHSKQSVELLSRHLKLINGLNPTIISRIIKELQGIDFSLILDGELVYIDNESGKEDFSKTVTLTKSLEAKEIDNLEFRAFDIIQSGIFSIRYGNLMNLFNKYFKSSSFLKIVAQDKIKLNDIDYQRLIDSAKNLNYEGFIIRRDCELKSGRSRDLLKIKPVQDDEFSVIDCEIGPMRLIDKTNGLEHVKQVLLSITIDFRGQKVNVGSGFSNAERIDFAKDPTKIVGKVVTIRYQSESDKIGRTEGKSLRFPIFKCIHGIKRTE